MKKVCILFCILGLLGCSSLKKADYELNARDFHQEFADNEVAASIRYDEKTIRLTGLVDNVSGDKHVVKILLYPDVTVVVTKNTEEASDIETYDRVTVQGICGYYEDELFGIPNTIRAITDSTIIDIDSNSDPDYRLSVRRLIMAVDDGTVSQYHYSIIEITGKYLSSSVSYDAIYYGENDYFVINDNKVNFSWDSKMEYQRENLVEHDTYTFECVLLSTESMFGTYNLENCRLA
jgi:hypothetical protein